MKASRREFLKATLGMGAAIGFLSQLLTFSKNVYAQALELVDMTKTKRKDPANAAAVGILTGMGYVDDVVAAEKAGKVKRADKPGAGGKVMPAAKQFCTNCGLIEDADVDTGKPGKCKVAAGVLVNGKSGYCNSYNVNPKAKI